MRKRTFASVTEISCTCRFLEDSAQDPDLPIGFDADLREYYFKEGSGRPLIYHCPFCGGAAPESRRGHLFEVIPQEEQERLFGMFETITTVEEAVRRFGPPDFDHFTVSTTPETENIPPRVEQLRTVVYSELSKTARVYLTDTPPGQLHISLLGKEKV